MFIERVIAGEWKTNAYLVGGLSRAIIIDPGHGSADELLLLAEKRGVSIQAIYLTHSHFDHFADVDVIKQKIDLPVYVSPEDAENLRRPGFDGLPNFYQKQGMEPDGFIREGDVVKLDDIYFKVIATPGHSPGSLCFYFEKEHVLFSGDTLFKRGRGATNAMNADERKIIASVKYLLTLPDPVVVYPGHGEKTTIGEEKKWHL
ncbi:MAG: MBL fold metallo-hydrolase [Chlamydiae bacterium]|nr:MBL fold metallo-hydrolase [Chlamydiota bacterium]